MNSLSIGTQIKHPAYGVGVIVDNSMEAAYLVSFPNRDQKAINKNMDGLEVVELSPSTGLSVKEVEQILTDVLRKNGGMVEEVDLGKKWEGGTVIIQPGNPDLKPKELPIDTFFNKIIMVRDRLRVLEQNINSHDSLSKEEKIHLQQYISRAYGSLTTFNALFRHKEDGFKS